MYIERGREKRLARAWRFSRPSTKEKEEEKLNNGYTGDDGGDARAKDVY